MMYYLNTTILDFVAIPYIIFPLQYNNDDYNRRHNLDTNFQILSNRPTEMIIYDK